MGKGLGPVPAKLEAASRTAAILPPATVLGIALILFTSVAPRPLLGDDCNCTVSSTVSQPNIQIVGTSTGTCPLDTRVAVHREGDSQAVKYCTGLTNCSITHNTFTSCLRTGEHTVTANCNCGRRRDLPNGGFSCDPASGIDTMTFSVNTTPTVGISSTQPNEEGEITLTTGYSYPNTSVGDPQRHLRLFGNGGQLATSYRSEASGTWILDQGTACWPQGSHQITAVATACQRIRRSCLSGAGVHLHPGRSHTRHRGTHGGTTGLSGRPSYRESEVCLSADRREQPARGEIPGISFRRRFGHPRQSQRSGGGCGEGGLLPVHRVCRSHRFGVCGCDYGPQDTAALPGLPPAGAQGRVWQAGRAVLPRGEVPVQEVEDPVSMASPADPASGRERGSTIWPEAWAAPAIRGRPPGTPSWGGAGPMTTRNGSYRPREAARGC